jgi:hypothetical protein
MANQKIPRCSFPYRYYAQVSFTAATRIHNRLHGLERFLEAQHLGLQVHRHLRTQRGSLNKQRFEQAYFRSWVIRFGQEY